MVCRRVVGYYVTSDCASCEIPVRSASAQWNLAVSGQGTVIGRVRLLIFAEAFEATDFSS